MAHQWFGDSVRSARWQDIWLNEGFAVYAEWLWSEHEGGRDPQDCFDDLTTSIAPDDAWWQLVIGDPGTADLFDGRCTSEEPSRSRPCDCVSVTRRSSGS